LPGLYSRFERNLDNGAEHCFRSTNNVRWSKESHSVEKPDEELLVGTEGKLVVRETMRS
jgi:hypothetical protein